MSAPEPNDAELVHASLAGNRDAFGRIVARYQALICSLAARTGREARIAAAERARDEVQAALDGARAGKPVTGGGTAPARVAPAPGTVMPREALMNGPKMQTLWLNSGWARFRPAAPCLR